MLKLMRTLNRLLWCLEAKPNVLIEPLTSLARHLSVKLLESAKGENPESCHTASGLDTRLSEILLTLYSRQAASDRPSLSANTGGSN